MLCSSAKNGAKHGALVIVVVAAATLAICAFASPMVDASATGTTSKLHRNGLPDPLGSTSPLRLQSKRRAEQEAANDDAINDDGYNYNYNYNEEVEQEEAYRGYITPKECVAYTISLGEDQYRTERNMGISVVGLESFMFFEYVIPYEDANEEAEYDYDYENENEDAGNEDQDEDNNRRILEQYDENNQENYGGETIYYGQNVITTKQWLTAFDENDGSSYGCTPMIDPIGVFQNYVQGLNDGKLSFSNLYYGPVCSNDNTSSNSTALFEMGIFLDSYCTAYVPGLSQILNEKIISEYTTGVSVQEKSGSSSSSSSSSLYYSTNTLYNYDGDYVNDCWSSDYTCDLKTLDTTQSTIHQFNYYHNRDDTDCQTYPEICQLVFKASVDLNSCQFLDYELSEEEEGEDSSDENNNYANDDQAIQESANNYGEFVEVVSSAMKYGDDNEEDEEDVVEEANYYQMFQEVIVDYLEFTIDTWYGGGDDDNEDAENAYNEESNAGICYGLLASASEGYSLAEWMDDNSRQLNYELDRVYQLDNPSYALWYGVGTLVALCALVFIFAVSCGFRNGEITDPAVTKPSGSETAPPVVPLQTSGGSKSDALLGGPPPKRNRSRNNPVKRIRQSVELC